MTEARKVLTEIARRLGEAPDRAAELTLRRAEISDRLHRVLDGLKQREAEVAGQVASEKNGDGKPKFPNEQARQAEAQRRLAADQDYQNLRQEADRLRQELRQLDAEIERVSRRHRSDAGIAYLAASLLAAGMREEFEAVLRAYGTPTPEAGAEKTDGLEEGVFRVLETKTSEKGVLRAWCEGPEGKVAVYAKGETAKALEESRGKEVKVRFRRLDKGLYAVGLA